MMKWKLWAPLLSSAALTITAPVAWAEQTPRTSDGLADFGAALIAPCNSILEIVFTQECGGGLRLIFPWLAFFAAALVGLALFRGQRQARQERDAVLKDAEAEIKRLKNDWMPNRSAPDFPPLRTDVNLFNVSASLLEAAIKCLEEGAAEPERNAIVATLVDLRQLLSEELQARGPELPAIGLRNALLNWIDRERQAGEPPRGVEAIWRLAAIDAVASRIENRLGLAIATVAARSVFEAAHLHVLPIRLLTPRASVQSEWLWRASLLEPSSDALGVLGRDAVRAAASATSAPESLIIDVVRFPILHGNVVARSGHIVLLGPTNL